MTAIILRRHVLSAQRRALPPQAVMAFELQDVVRHLWRRKLMLAASSLTGLAAATIIAYALPRTYVAEGQVVVRAEASLAADAERAFYSTSVNDAAVTTERDVLAARGLISRVADSVVSPADQDSSGSLHKLIQQVQRALPGERTQVDPVLAALETRDRRIAAVARALSTSADKGSSVINVRGTSTDPQFSATIVQTLLSLYMKDRLAAQQQANRNVEVALRERLQQARDDISRAEAKVSALMMQPQLIESAEVPDAARPLTVIGSRLAEAQADLATRRATYQAVVSLRDAGGGNPAQIVAMLDQGAQSTSDLRRLLATAQSDLNRVSEAGESHPARIAARAAVTGYAARMSGEASRLMAQRQAELAGAEQTVASLFSQYTKLRQDASRVSPQRLDLDRERETLQNLRRVAGTIEDRLIAVAAQPVDANARVLTVPDVPIIAAFPNKSMFAAAGYFVSLALAGTVSLAREFLRRGKPSVIRQVEQFGTRLIGSTPELCRPALRGGLPATFQGIALEIERIAERDGARVFTITSAESKEGKTTVAVSLALTLGKLGHSVLLMNCDLHQPMGSISGLQKVPQSQGDGALPGLLVDPVSHLHLLRAVQADSGDPVAALRAPAFAAMLGAARGCYDFVICDTPPVLSVPDALVVGRLSDGFVVVAQSSNVDNPALTYEVVRRLTVTGQPVFGVIATKVPEADLVLGSYSGYAEHPPTRSMLRALGASGLR